MNNLRFHLLSLAASMLPVVSNLVIVFGVSDDTLERAACKGRGRVNFPVIPE